MAVHGKPSITDYNTIQTKVANILGAGSATSGYGQPLKSSPVSVGTKNTATRWDNLKNDILSIHRHQNGFDLGIVDLSPGDKIRYEASQPMFQYDSIINTLTTTKFNVSPTQAQTVNKGTQNATFPGLLGADWKAQLNITLTYTFSTANNARWFFNSGGLMRFSSSRTGGSSHPQNSAWTSILGTAGLVSIGANVGALKNIYQLTNAYQTIHSTVASGVYGYSTNEFRISAKCNVTNNVNGTARIFNFYVQWLDNETTSGDSVDGTFSLSANTLEPTGQLFPTGTFTVQSPTLTATGFSAT